MKNKKNQNNKDVIYRNNSELTDKNGYMKYELNNTFNDKDDVKNNKESLTNKLQRFSNVKNKNIEK